MLAQVVKRHRTLPKQQYIQNLKAEMDEKLEALFHAMQTEDKERIEYLKNDLDIIRLTLNALGYWEEN